MLGYGLVTNILYYCFQTREMKAPKNPLPHPLVYIIWDDACSNSGWHNEKELEEWSKETNGICHEVGWLVEETKEHYIVVSRVMPKNETDQSNLYGLIQRIPKTWAKIYTLIPKNKSLTSRLL